MTNKEFIDVIERFKNGLKSRASGKEFLETDYKNDRELILKNPKIKDITPVYVRNCRTTDDFWSYIQPKFPTYAERRKFINDSMNEIILFLESSSEFDVFSNTENYELGERLGNGGFGEVYKYHHKLLDFDFAIKILNPVFVSNDENIEYEKRFFREAKILFNLDHKNIIKIYDIGRIDDKAFIRMELVDGYNMFEFIAKHSIVNFERSKKPILALLDGLRFAHSKGVIHRDLKPSNYMVTYKGDFKIIDFGISAFLENEAQTKLTRPGVHIAGGLYTDPYLMQNPQMRDCRSDIYSVGAIWYYLLTGRAPSGSDMKGVLLQSAEITSLQADIVMKCLAQNIDDRYLNCNEIINRLNPPIQSGDTLIKLIPNHLITEITREAIFEFLENFNEYNAAFWYYGRKNEIEFLNRLYKLSEIPSNEDGFKSFKEEIYHHTINLDDFGSFWIFDDERLGLKYGEDEILLKFLCEMFHPAVRKEQNNWRIVLDNINRLLNEDGYEIYESNRISNREVFSYRYKI